MPAALLVRVIFWVWFATAVAVGHFRLLQRLPPFAVQAIIVGLTATLLYGYFRVASLREWANTLNLRALVALHVTRFVGIYFIVLYQRGELARAFAVPAGLGDILVATIALTLVVLPLTPPVRHRAIRIWNVVGFADMVMVVVTATRITLSDPAGLRPLTHLPLSLLPTFLVPLILATHVIIFMRTIRDE